MILPETETIIKARLASIAEEYQIKIIYACESGSRAWGFPSPNSDYDVRFIYIHPDLSICRNTMDQSFDGETVKIKKYFYRVRPLLAALWIERYQTVPPMELALLLPVIDDQIDIQKCILDLQIRKLHIDEQVPIPRIAMLDDFLVRELARLQDAAKILPVRTGDRVSLDHLFQQCLGL